MASKAFVAVSWSPNQLIDEDTLDQMNNNITYLRDHSVDGLYQHTGGGGTTTGIKILCGRVFIPGRKQDMVTETIHFRNFFSATANPVVTTSITSTSQRKVFHTIVGLNQTNPDHRGFKVQIATNYTMKSRDRVKNMWVNWIAMGY